MSYELLLNCFSAILMTIEPPGLIPLFLAITAGMTPEQRSKTAIEGSIIGYLVLIIAALFGNFVLKALGVSIPAFRIAGGFLLLFIGFEMVFDKFGKEKEGAMPHESNKKMRSVSAFPLAVPLISGPGAISTTMMFSGKMQGFWAQSILLTIITICMAITYLVLILAQRIDRFLGEGGRSVLTRIVGILLAAMSVQFIVNGFVEGLNNGSFL